MIITSASRLRAKRRQQRLARKATFAFADFATHLHRDESVEDRACSGGTVDDSNAAHEMRAHESVLYFP
jgi:hypothetical protein